MIAEAKKDMRRVGYGLPLALVLSLLLAMSGVLALLVLRPAERPTTALPAGRGPTVVTVRVMPARLTLLDTVTVTATFYNSGSSAGPYAATLQLLAPGRRLSATQDGFLLHHGQRLTLYWEWRAGASLPTGLYTVRVLLRAAARPGHVVANGTASTPLAVVTR